jgi:hypothetical protein
MTIPAADLIIKIKPDVNKGIGGGIGYILSLPSN